MIDLSQDVDLFVAAVREAVTRYVRGEGSPGPSAQQPPVTRVEVELGLTATPPEAYLHFDTRTPPGDDGDWTHRFYAIVAFPHWSDDFSRASSDLGMQVVQVDGSSHVVNRNTFAQTFHGFFARAILAARDVGALEPLPKAPGCELVVSCFECGYTWPDPDDRGLKNMADPRENNRRLSTEPPRTEEQRLADDRNVYTVRAVTEGPSRAALIAAINRALGIGIPAARKLLDRGEPVARHIEATEVARLAQVLASRGVRVQVEPEFPHRLPP